MARTKKKTKAIKPATAPGQPQKSRLWLMYPPKLITTPVIWQLSQ
jgi:hypothetical protein